MTPKVIAMKKARLELVKDAPRAYVQLVQGRELHQEESPESREVQVLQILIGMFLGEEHRGVTEIGIGTAVIGPEIGVDVTGLETETVIGAIGPEIEIIVIDPETGIDVIDLRTGIGREIGIGIGIEIETATATEIVIGTEYVIETRNVEEVEAEVQVEAAAVVPVAVGRRGGTEVKIEVIGIGGEMMTGETKAIVAFISRQLRAGV